MKQLLDGKKIIVAGAAGLLGKALVKGALAQGAQVIATDIKVNAMRTIFADIALDLDPQKLLFDEIDVTDEESISACFRRHQGVNGAVNCSYPRNKSYGSKFLDVSMIDFNENLALQLGSAFAFMKNCVSIFGEQELPFSLVNISSIYGVVAPKFEIYKGTDMTTPVEYAAIKSAIIHLTKYATSFVNNSDFRVNCVSPGGLLDNQPSEFCDKYKSNTLGVGMLDAEDIVGAVMFLWSDQAKYVNGQNIIVDDGFSL